MRTVAPAAVGLTLLATACGPVEPPPAPDLLITSVRVVDVERGLTSPPSDLSVRAGRIQSIDPPGQGPPTDSATQVLDGDGLFAMPGLHDMHSHLWNRSQLADTYLQNGITSVRDMGGAQDNWATWQAEADSIPVPRAMNAGSIVDGLQSVSFFFTEARSAEAARARVDELQGSGADFIKVYSRLTPEAFSAIATRARELGLGFSGHVPYAVPASRALREGMGSIEHFTGVALECSSRESGIRRRIEELLAPLQADSVDASLLSAPLQEAYRLERWEALDDYDPSECADLMQAFESGEVWVTPTLVVAGDGPEAKLSRVEPHLSSWPEWMHGMMRPQSSEPVLETPERIATLRQMFSELDALGVRWLAGSDAPNPGSAPGVGLHHELELLVDFGLTPLRALQAATLHAAEFEGRADESGSLTVGKDADIVLSTGDPLENITNTQSIQAVILRGRVVARP
ncbi:MAG: amidohydrolase family protein [Gemmatimonadetes bacterium]|nr:amidohydrolase family protein [Gemmatimonadota bacterium]